MCSWHFVRPDGVCTCAYIERRCNCHLIYWTTPHPLPPTHYPPLICPLQLCSGGPGSCVRVPRAYGGYATPRDCHSTHQSTQNCGLAVRHLRNATEVGDRTGPLLKLCPQRPLQGPTQWPRGQEHGCQECCSKGDLKMSTLRYRTIEYILPV